MITAKPDLTQGTAAKQTSTDEAGGGFMQVLASLGSDEAGVLSLAGAATQSNKLPKAETGAEKMAETLAENPENLLADQATLAANMLALCGVPVTPPVTLPNAMQTSVDVPGLSVADTGTKTAGISTAGIATEGAATDNGPLQPVSVGATSTLTTALNDQGAINDQTRDGQKAATTAVTSFDLQWLRSNARALPSPSDSSPVQASLVQTSTLSAATTSAATAALDSPKALPTNAEVSVAQNSDFQSMVEQAAPMLAMLSAQGRDEPQDATQDSAAQSGTQIDALGGLGSSQLQTTGTQLASDAKMLEASARHQLQSAVGSHQWATELGNKLTLLASKDTQSATLYMTPADLGPVQVRIETNQDQASVWFTAEHADTRTALEQSLPRLREMFAAQGMSLTDAGVFGDRSRQQQPQTPSPAVANTGYQDAVTLEDTARVRSISLSLLDAYA